MAFKPFFLVSLILLAAADRAAARDPWEDDPFAADPRDVLSAAEAQVPGPPPPVHRGDRRCRSTVTVTVVPSGLAVGRSGGPVRQGGRATGRRWAGPRRR